MRRVGSGLILLLSCAAIGAAGLPSHAAQSGAAGVAEEIITLERAALDRWITADPQGYLSLYLSEITYFDPSTELRLSGLEAMERHVAPMRGARLPFTNPRYEMIAPRVEQYGDLALLTFNLVNYGRRNGEPEEAVLARWNATEMYRRTPDGWKIIHSHWSLTRPNMPRPAI